MVALLRAALCEGAERKASNTLASITLLSFVRTQLHSNHRCKSTGACCFGFAEAMPVVGDQVGGAHSCTQGTPVMLSQLPLNLHTGWICSSHPACAAGSGQRRLQPAAKVCCAFSPAPATAVPGPDPPAQPEPPVQLWWSQWLWCSNCPDGAAPPQNDRCMYLPSCLSRLTWLTSLHLKAGALPVAILPAGPYLRSPVAQRKSCSPLLCLHGAVSSHCSTLLALLTAARPPVLLPAGHTTPG